MNYKTLLICLLLCICTACTAKPSYPEDYTFPPENKAELKWAMREAKLDWSIQDNEVHPTAPLISPSPFAIHSIISKDGLVEASINMSEPLSGRAASITFAYHEQTIGDVLRFEENDWVSMWSLSGILFESTEEIKTLYQQWSANFKKETSGSSGDSLLWNGKEGNVYCQVVFTWHPVLKMYVPDGIYLDELHYLEKRCVG